MHENWPLIHKYVLAYEGGYVNHPKDPGGATNFGVTQRVYDAYRRRTKTKPRSVRHITHDEVDVIYRRQYWGAVHGDELPSGLDLTVYDFAVNSGPKRAVQFMQRQLGVTDDGVIGNVTLEAVGNLTNSRLRQVIKGINDARFAWLKTLRHWSSFGKGWQRRVQGANVGIQGGDYGVIDRSVALIGNSPLPAPVVDDNTPVGIAARTDGQKEQKNLMTVAKGVVGDGRAISTAVGVGGLTTVQNVAETDGPLAWGISAAIVILALGAVVLVIKELKDG